MHYFAILATVLVTFFTRSTTATPAPAGPSSAHDIITPNGTINYDVYIKFLSSCGSPGSNIFLKKALAPHATECGLLEETTRVFNPYRLACAMGCLMRKMGYITPDLKFLLETEKISKVYKSYKTTEDKETVANVAQEIRICGKLAPQFLERNCYSAIPYGTCLVLAYRRACVND